jgi:hypothetical protein
MAKRSKKQCEELPILHPDAAGIDVSASELFVAVSADRDPQPVRSFPTFTRDLSAIADWLGPTRCSQFDEVAFCSLICTSFTTCFTFGTAEAILSASARLDCELTSPVSVTTPFLTSYLTLL